MSEERTYGAQFPRTSWSAVSQAKQGDRAACFALEQICRDYWYPFTRLLAGVGDPLKMQKI